MEKASELVLGRALEPAVPLSFNRGDGTRRAPERYRGAEIPEAFAAEAEAPAASQ